ncbi:hypothetical protein [Anaerocolumna sp.]|uniref:hypothetical protein n=1 Tax=Anaerocolumna sp. TaxID=2041569 RepID=UPI0028A72255|nr:hypothetical protein [Anaerocolumna sp.]
MKYIVDTQATASYMDKYNQPCDCIYCRNYQKAFASYYPEVIKRLKDFGIQVERPLEIIDCFWNSTRDKRRYESYYSVKGNLMEDKLELYKENAIITLYRSDTNEPVYGNTGMEKPYFILAITNIELPWVLSELPNE